MSYQLSFTIDPAQSALAEEGWLAPRSAAESPAIAWRSIGLWLSVVAAVAVLALGWSSARVR